MRRNTKTMPIAGTSAGVGTPTNNVEAKTVILFAAFLLLCLLGPVSAWAQSSGGVSIYTPFTQRTSVYSPETKVYHIQGNYQMIGNTNLISVATPTSSMQNNETAMRYVDIDGDANTTNSSSAQLKFSTERGANPECTHVVYAGLYWAGRKSANTSGSDDMYVNLPGGKRLVKNQVKFKHEDGTYQTITAATNEIFYTTGGTVAQTNALIYVAYSEVTDIIRQYGEGNYFVADVCTAEGTSSSGYCGGWGLVVVYENSKMKWRDITLFDGCAQVNGKSGLVTLPIDISGFKSVQVGHVNMTLGMMAAEGDGAQEGDWVQIKNTSNQFLYMDHQGNTYTSAPNGSAQNNFFNGETVNGDLARNPSYVNNMGIDLQMITLDNTNNSIITNNQTSTTFRFGASSENYSPFFFAFGCDAYIPDARVVDAVMESETVIYDQEQDLWVTHPGDTVTFTMKLHNFEDEDIRDAQIRLPLPITLEFCSMEEAFTDGVTGSYYYDPTQGVHGTAVWNIDYLPAGYPDSVWTICKLHCTVTEDCYTLAATRDCILKIVVNGTLSGTSVVNGIEFENEFIQGFQQTGVCQGSVISNDLVVLVDRDNYIISNCNCAVDDSYDNSCYVTRTLNYCSTSAPEHDSIPYIFVSEYYPLGTRFFNLSRTIEYTPYTGFPESSWGSNILVVAPSDGDNVCESYVIILKSVSGALPDPPVFSANSINYCYGSESSSLRELLSSVDSTKSSIPYVAFYMENPESNPDAPGMEDIYPSTTTVGTQTYWAVQYLPGDPCYHSSPIQLTVTVHEVVTVESSHGSESCQGTAVTFTPNVLDGTFIIPAEISSYVTASGNVATISSSAPAGTYTFTYQGASGIEIVAPCDESSLNYTITHIIHAQTVGGSVSSATICLGTPVPELTLTGYTGHVMRWEYRKSSTATWTTIANNTDHISQADLVELTSGTYYFRALLRSGNCDSAYSSQGTLTVNSTAAPSSPSTQVQYFCVGESYTLQPSGSNYRWYTSETGGTSDVSLRNGVMDGTWVQRYVSNTNGGCESQRVLVEARPKFAAGAIASTGQTICSATSPITIGPTENASFTDGYTPGTGEVIRYQWYLVDGTDTTIITGATGATYTPTETAEGTYTYIRKAKTSGCSNWVISQGSWTLTIGNPDATITAVPGSAVICGTSGSVTLSLSAAVPEYKYNYQWYKDNVLIAGATSRSYVATSAGNYTAKVTHRNSGCNSTSSSGQSVDVVFNTPSVTMASISPAAICAGDDTTLTASTTAQTADEVTYTWTPATGLSATDGTSVTASPTATTTYTVIATASKTVNTETCTATDTSFVTVTVNPTPTLSATDTSIVYGTSATLKATGANTYVWAATTYLGSSTSSSTSFSGANVGTYNYTITGANSFGCTATTTSSVTVTPVTSAITVNIVGNTGSFDFDGNPHSVTGYSATSDNALYNAALESNFSYSGDSTATRTAAGTAPMGLQSADFTNTNTNFSDVTFNITDGWIKITEEEGLIIKSNNQSWVYDGNAHSYPNYVVIYAGDTAIADGTGRYFTLTTGDTVHIINPASVTYVSETGTGNNTFNYTLTNAHLYTDIDTVYGNLEITKKPITIIGDSDNKNYDGTPLIKDSWTISSSTPLASTDELIDVTMTGSQTVPGNSNNVPSDAVIYKNGTTTDVSANYDITYTNGTLEVTPNTAPITVVSGDGSWTYDGTAHTQPTYTVLYDGIAVVTDTTGLKIELPTGDTLTITPSVTATVTNVSESGTDNNTFDIAIQNAGNYSGTIEKQYGDLTITQRAITITAGTASKSYDGTPLTKDQWTLTSGSIASTDVIDTVHVTGSQTVPGSTPNVASNARIVTDGTSTNVTSNYSITYVDGSLTVAQSDSIIRIVSVDDSWIYDGTTHHNYTYHVYYGNVEATRDATDTLRFALPTGDVIDVTPGTDAGVTFVTDNETDNNDFTYSFPNADRYSGTVVTEFGTIAINKRLITIIGDSASKSYDGTPLAKDSWTISGSTPLAPTDELIDVTMTGSQTEVGTSANTPSSAVIQNAVTTTNTTDNYEITYTPGNLTVTPNNKPIDIISKDTTCVYDGEEHTYEVYVVTYDGNPVASDPTGTKFELPTGDTIVITPTTVGISEYADNTPGNNTFTYTIENESQYSTGSITTDYGTITISRRPLELTANSTTVEYDGDLHTYTETAVPYYTNTGDSALVAGQVIDTIIITGQGRLVGNYPTVITSGSVAIMDGTNDVTANYDITLLPGEIEITNRSTQYVIDLYAKSDTVVYDGTAHTLSGFNTLEFVVDGNTYFITDTSVTATVTGTNVNEYTNTITGTPIVTDIDGNDVTSQFTVNKHDGNLKINVAPLTITISDTIEYNAAPLVTDYSEAVTTGLVSGDALTAGAATTNSANVGTYTYAGSTSTISTSFGTTYGIGNYDVTYVINQTIVPSGALVLNCPSDTVRKYNGESLRVVATASAPDHSIVTIEYSTDDGTTWNTVVPSITHVSESPLTVKVRATNSNYVTSTCQYNLTINKRILRLVSADSTQVYDNTPLTRDSVRVEGDGWAAGEGASITVSGTQTNAGTSDNTFTYTLNPGMEDGDYDITPVFGDLTVTPVQNVVVTITEHGDVVQFDETTHTVTGYDVTVTTDPSGLYNATCFTYHGSVADTTETGTAPGVYPMNVVASDFENTSLNFDTVTFIVVDDSLLIYDTMHIVNSFTHNAFCYGVNDGSVNLTLAGGLPDSHNAYTYTLSGLNLAYNASGSTDALGNISMTGLAADTYTLVATDTAGNNFSHQFCINGSTELVPTIVFQKDPCPNQTSYPVSVNVTGGVAPYNYTWTGVTSATEHSANANVANYDASLNDENHTYSVSVTVIDNFGCVSTRDTTFTTVDNIERPGAATFTAAADTTVTLAYTHLDTLIHLTPPTLITSLPDVIVTNNAPASNRYSEGVTTITWTATDTCGNSIAVNQKVTVNYADCGTEVFDADGNRYDVIQIGPHCWTGQNARTDHYSSNEEIPAKYKYLNSDSLYNLYGYLYSWYSALGVPEGDDSAEPLLNAYGRTQGICPDGWAIPTQEEYLQMVNYSGGVSQVKAADGLYWYPIVDRSTPGSGFDARGAGLYNSAYRTSYYELMGYTYFWTDETASSTSRTRCPVKFGPCGTEEFSPLSKNCGASIRCIRIY